MEELRKIRAALAAGISKSAIAERAECARRILDGLDSPDFNPTLKTLIALANAAEALAAEQIDKLKGVA